jgi:hypothetical protein
VHSYRTNEKSPFHQLAFKTRRLYNTLINRLLKDCHGFNMADINEERVNLLYGAWSDGGKKIAMGHSLVTMFRRLVNFGDDMLHDAESRRVSLVLHKMRFATAGVRSEQLTAAQVDSIRAKAHEMGHHSIALAQALQFELGLQQKDVLGEWLPIGEAGHISEITWSGKKWTRGIRWSQIDDNLVLRHTIRLARRQPEDAEFDLRQAPMVMRELALIPEERRSGPVVVRESTQRPWSELEFREKWRGVANAAGLPLNVRNSDGRARANTRATDVREDLAQATRR